ncbi:MAG TPA: S26 family signal peptidase [Vitreimonas sp.]|uniref:S26 family signal peptidase n=1 Tax=Vitreimonas sp. TaxID=3069702 RepID=UPI002D4E43DF|nr:S26 family signal peptidase [Vitreimonas sp.]HYD89470.1 S26 family signal peptidase [Vitreimonas sp.]
MKRLRRHRFVLLGAGCAVAALALASVLHQDLILFNHSPSIPVGFYVRTEGPIEAGALATVRALNVAPDEARRRSYADVGDRFIKRVAAVAGQTVCGDGESISVDGRVAASVYQSRERTTPRGWVGCRTLGPDEVLLLGDSADSFDGRYWGPISTRLIEGVWRPL